MDKTLDYFIAFVEGYFEEEKNDRNSKILYKRFGINSNKTYTLDEIGLLNDGITRERVRQIIDNEISRMRMLINGQKLPKVNYVCHDILIKNIKNILQYVNKERAIKKEQCRKVIGLEYEKKDVEGWEKLFLKILNISVLKKYVGEDEILLSYEIDEKLFVKELEIIYKILRKNIIYKPIEEIIIEAKKNRRKLDIEYIKLCVKSLNVDIISKNGVEMYAIKIDNNFSAGDLAYRVLWEEEKPLSTTELYKIVNKKLKCSSCSKSITKNNLVNQIVAYDKITNIGGVKWALKNWKLDKKSIKEIIRDILLESAESLSKGDIVQRVKKKREDIKEKSIISYLSYDEFIELIDGKVILKEWRGQYIGQIKGKRKRQNFNQLIIDTFKYYGKEQLTTEEIWEYLKTRYHGQKYYVRNYLLQKEQFISRKFIDDTEYWMLLNNDKNRLSEGFSNKVDHIRYKAQEILEENSRSMKLVDLRKNLCDLYGFNEQSVYTVLSDKKLFKKYSLNKGSMIISLNKKEGGNGIKLIDITEEMFEEFMNKSKSEESRFDFKQGFYDLSEKRKFDSKSFQKIMMNICAMSNHGKDIKGRLFIGITDKESDSLRVKKLDRITVDEINNFGVVGVEREAVLNGYDLEKYQNYILEKISKFQLPDKLKNHIKSNIGYIHYKGKYIIMIEVDCIDGPSLYNETEMYIRNGPNLQKVENTASEYPQVFRRCFN